MKDRQNSNHENLLEQATRALRQTPVPNGPSKDALAEVVTMLENAANQTQTFSFTERVLAMKSQSKMIAAAASLLIFGGAIAWMLTAGGGASIALANVADVLNSLRSATFDMATEVKGEEGQPPATATGKGFFLAPSHQRIEVSLVTTAAKTTTNHVTIIDGQAAKFTMLMPDQKLAISIDMKKMKEEMSNQGAPPDIFERVRRLVREGSSSTGEKVEKLGKKEIDGREAVGFRIRASMMDMTLWADPETAWPIRIEVVMDMMTGAHVVMNNFRYNVDLDSSLFRLEPPPGYSIQAMEMTMPVEEDLLRTLRMLAKHSKDLFPEKLGMNKKILKLLMAEIEPELDKIKAKYVKEPPAAMKSEIMKATMPLMQKQMRGLTFYSMLQPENDPHYVGGGVKLGTPDRPIFWYRPADSKNYRVIYADLSVEEVAPEELKGFPEASGP